MKYKKTTSGILLALITVAGCSSGTRYSPITAATRVPSATPVYAGDLDFDKYCVYDLNADGKVGTADLLELLAQWGTTGPQADFDYNEIVSTTDLLVLQANWGDCPEPSIGIGHPQRITGLWFSCIWCQTAQEVTDLYHLIRNQTYSNAKTNIVVVLNNPNPYRVGWTYAEWRRWDKRTWLSYLDELDRVLANEPTKLP